MKKYFVLFVFKNPLGNSGESCGAAFDFSNSCEVCKSGSKMIGPLPVKGIQSGKDIFCTYNDDLLLSLPIYEKIINADNSAKECFYNVVNAKNGLELPFMNLRPNYVLPPMLPISEGITIGSYCSNCKRDMRFDKHLKLSERNSRKDWGINYIYSELDISDEVHFLNTWEHFGGPILHLSDNITGLRYPKPRIIVSEKIKEVLTTVNKLIWGGVTIY